MVPMSAGESLRTFGPIKKTIECGALVAIGSERPTGALLLPILSASIPAGERETARGSSRFESEEVTRAQVSDRVLLTTWNDGSGGGEDR
jgi:hypothetical protein